MKLVERVGSDPDRQEERGEGGAETVGVEDGRGGGAQGDVAEVPGGVGRVQQRDEVAPPARRQGIEGRPLQPRVLRCGGRRGPPT